MSANVNLVGTGEESQKGGEKQKKKMPFKEIIDEVI